MYTVGPIDFVRWPLYEAKRSKLKAFFDISELIKKKSCQIRLLNSTILLHKKSTARSQLAPTVNRISIQKFVMRKSEQVAKQLN